jgi:hypothetical protein
MNSDPEPTEDRRRQLSRIAGIEGYLSLPIIVLAFCNPLFSLLPESYLPPIWITMLGCGLLFAISGVRHGTGMARVVAGLSLAILVAYVLVIAMH